MGKADTAAREYINDANIFADIFNYYIFGGEKVIKPEKLEELDTSLLSVFGKDGDEETIQRYRDVLKKAAVKTDEEAAYVVLGVEAQTHIDYGMPIRTLLYDALQYDRQARKIKNAHVKDKDKHNEDEFTSGLYKEDKILPVITVVIYFGAKPWDGAVSLRDLYLCKHKELLKFAPDYKMNLIEPARMSSEDFEKFSTSMGRVLKFIKLSKNKSEMNKLLETDKAYERIDRNAVRVLQECANISLEIDSSAEVIDMCKAWKDMQEEVAIKSTIAAGRKFGVTEDRILSYIITQFKLTKENAEEYMTKESA